MEGSSGTCTSALFAEVRCRGALSPRRLASARGVLAALLVTPPPLLAGLAPDARDTEELEAIGVWAKSLAGAIPGGSAEGSVTFGP